jgi:hypothetical protein
MRLERRTRVVASLWLLFATMDLSQAVAVRRRIRGSSAYQSRQLNDVTEIKVRALEKADEKLDKEAYKEENEETDFPTTSPTWTQSSVPTTSSALWSPSSPAMMNPTVATAGQNTFEPSTSGNNIPYGPETPSVSIDDASSQAQETLKPSSDKVESDPGSPLLLPTSDMNKGNSTSPEEDTLDPSSEKVENDSDSTLLSPPFDVDSTNNTLSPGALPNTLATSPSLESRSSSPRGVVGVIVGICSVACLGSFYLVAKRRQHRQDLPGGDNMVEEGEVEDEHSFPPPSGNICKMNWSDVFHHSLVYEENIDVAPDCRTKSRYLPSIVEKTKAEDDGGNLQDVTLSSPKQHETVCLGPMIKDGDTTPAVSPWDSHDLDDRVDLYTQTIMKLMDCGIITEDDGGEEKKCQETQDLRSVASQDLECMYGTHPSDHLPATPRTSNVSPRGKPEVSQLAFLPTLPKYRPEMRAEDNGEACDLLWI